MKFIFLCSVAFLFTACAQTTEVSGINGTERIPAQSGCDPRFAYMAAVTHTVQSMDQVKYFESALDDLVSSNRDLSLNNYRRAITDAAIVLSVNIVSKNDSENKLKARANTELAKRGINGFAVDVGKACR